MPLGNLTSQFFANVFLNELDQFVKHKLKAEFYIRYVDDFVIFHNDKEVLEKYTVLIKEFLKSIQLELHQDKSKIILLDKGITFLGYRVYYHHRLLKKSNLRKFGRFIKEQIPLAEENSLEYDTLTQSLYGWMEYARHANTHSLRVKILGKIERKCQERISGMDIDRWAKQMNKLPQPTGQPPTTSI